jgi:hypothetical protein
MKVTVQMIQELASDLEAKGYWTELLKLNFENEHLPEYRLEYGPILSNGLCEKMIGYYNIYKDKMTRHHTL